MYGGAEKSKDPGPWTLDPGPWTLDPGPWTLDQNTVYIQL